MVSETAGILNMITGAGIVVKFVMLLLLFASIASWAIIFLKYRYIKNAYKESLFFIEAFWKSKNLSDAFARSKKLRACPVARIFRTGYIELKKVTQIRSGGAGNIHLSEKQIIGSESAGIENIKRSLRRSISTEITKLSQLVPFLATAGNTAPFVGLFGTVWGIMNTFQEIGQSGSASLAVVAPGISEALIATAAGLAVAIPSVVAYNYFINKIKVIDSELNSFAADFLNIIERDILGSKNGK